MKLKNNDARKEFITNKENYVLTGRTRYVHEYMLKETLSDGNSIVAICQKEFCYKPNDDGFGAHPGYKIKDHYYTLETKTNSLVPATVNQLVEYLKNIKE